MVSNLFIEKMEKVNRPKARNCRSIIIPYNIDLTVIVASVNTWLQDNPNVFIFNIQYMHKWQDGVLVPDTITPANTNIVQTIYYTALINYTLDQE